MNILKSCLSAILLLTFCPSIQAQITLENVSPATADPGDSSLTVTFTLPDSTPPTPPIHNQPTSATIGSITGSALTRVDFNTVTAVFSFPANESTGLKSAIVTFETQKGTVQMTADFTLGSVGADAPPPASGYNLYSPLGSTETILIDNNQNVMNTWTSTYGPGLSMYLLDNGDLLRTADTSTTDFVTGGAAGRIERYDWEGNLIWEFDYDSSSYRSHHDIEVLPNGNILLVAWQLKTEAEAIAAGRDPSQISEGELWPDSILEIEPTGASGGNIVWEWHVWDHLIQDFDATKSNYGVVEDHPEKIDINYMSNSKADWNHINAIDYHEERDQIIVSVRNFSEIWVIDHSSSTAEASGSAGDLLYRWGNPAAYGAEGTQTLFVQHDAKWIEPGLPGAGNILIFNNGQGRDDGDYSSVEEISLPLLPDESYDTSADAGRVWTYISPTPTDFYASRISGAQRLKNGNTLICEGTSKYVFEVDNEGELIWEFNGSGELFRFERYAPDFAGFQSTELALPSASYPIVDTAQDSFYNNQNEISAPAVDESFYGQDAHHSGNQPSYEISADDKTVYDYNTRLTWTRSPDWNEDGEITVDDKMTQAEAATFVASLNAANFGGYNDWRLPSIKEVYSLMDFRGTDPMSDDTSTLVPFIHPDYFEYAWGDLDAMERTVDSQVATTSIHLDTILSGPQAMSGLNIVDGRIKAYPTSKNFLVYLCRGNTDYAKNSFHDHGDGTVTDEATELMWMKNDSGSDMLWADALSYVQTQNAANHLGYNDWRLPNAKELQSLVDYNRAPTATDSPAIDPILNCSEITNENGDKDWPWYFTSTTHARQDGTGSSAVYICFGRATGYHSGKWDDVHGSGAQRSDAKIKDIDGYTYQAEGWYFTSSPQGDAARWYNYVRLVRDAPPAPASLTLTTDPQTVAFDIKTITISGSTSGTATQIDWQNALSGESGQLTLDSADFDISSIPLDMGENVITLTVTFSGADSIETTIAITRADSFDGDILYVHDESSATADQQNGRTWATAFSCLQDALALVSSGQEIHVSGGVYYPDEADAGYADVTDDDRDSSFVLPSGVSLFGAYDHSTELRDVENYMSILNGDLDQDDNSGEGGIVSTDPSNNTKNNNAYSVITVEDNAAEETSLLDGFVITAGRANAQSPNAAKRGGGLYLQSVSGFSMANCHFIGNMARENGGAVYWNDSDPQSVENCTFESNESYEYGAAVYLDLVTLTLNDCVFILNKASGSTVYIREASGIFHRNRFQGNDAEGGGALSVYSTGSAETYNCLFSGNRSLEGGAIFSWGTFFAQNSTFAENYASSYGGGIYAFIGSNVTLSNCILAANEDVNGVDSSSANLMNLIATIRISSSCIPGSGGSANWSGALGTDDGGNLDADPLFMDPDSAGAILSLNGDYRLDENSPAVNAGENAASMDGEIDLAGNPRVANQRVDMGAYECADLWVTEADTDEDGIGDWDELTLYHTDSEITDSDGDGCGDGDELTAGTDPADGNSVLASTLTLAANGDITIEWPSVYGRVYLVQHTDDLSADNWKTIGIQFYQDGLESTTLLAEDIETPGFYRIGVELMSLE